MSHESATYDTELAGIIYRCYRRNDCTREGESLDEYIDRMCYMSDVSVDYMEWYISRYGPWKALQAFKERFNELPPTHVMWYAYIASITVRPMVHKMMEDNEPWEGEFDEDEEDEEDEDEEGEQREGEG